MTFAYWSTKQTTTFYLLNTWHPCAKQPSFSLNCTGQVIFSAHWIFIQSVAGESITVLSGDLMSHRGGHLDWGSVCRFPRGRISPSACPSIPFRQKIMWWVIKYITSEEEESQRDVAVILLLLHKCPKIFSAYIPQHQKLDRVSKNRNQILCTLHAARNYLCWRARGKYLAAPQIEQR